MRSKLKAISFIGLLAISTIAFAGAKNPKKLATIHGKVESVDGTDIKIIAKGTETTIKTDENTKFFLDDKPATLADVKPNERLIASPQTDIPATEIRLISKKKHNNAGSTTQPAAGSK